MLIYDNLDDLLSQDVWDTRDLIALIEHLEEEAEVPEDYEVQPVVTDGPGVSVCGTCRLMWDDSVSTSRTPVPSGRCPFEVWHDPIEDLARARKLGEECECLADYPYGEAVIADSYFEQYARELADDLGYTDNRERAWPYTHIDWTGAAKALQQDYTSIEFEGRTFWARA